MLGFKVFGVLGFWVLGFCVSGFWVLRFLWRVYMNPYLERERERDVYVYIYIRLREGYIGLHGNMEGRVGMIGDTWEFRSKIALQG